MSLRSLGFLAPPDVIPHDAKLYIDGSMIDGKHSITRRLGFGIVVVGRDGTLIAFGNGTPPAWAMNAAGAEAWAFYTTLAISPHIPITITDCLGLLSMLSLGAFSATLANRPFARIWRMIFGTLDLQDGGHLINKSLIWMPAHCPVHSIGSRARSDGRMISAIDWRANRLVDALAKMAAKVHTVPPIANKILKDAFCAAEYMAASLGAVTYASNHHKVEYRNSDGVDICTVVRDSTPGDGNRNRQTCPRRSNSPPTDNGASIDSIAKVDGCTGLPAFAAKTSTAICPSASAESAKLFRAQHASRMRANAKMAETRSEMLFQKWWRQSRSSKSFRATLPGEASRRLEALRMRIHARL